MSDTPPSRPAPTLSPTVEQPPSLRETLAAIEEYARIREDRPELTSGAAWDLARARCWSHWRDGPLSVVRSPLQDDGPQTTDNEPRTTDNEPRTNP